MYYTDIQNHNDAGIGRYPFEDVLAPYQINIMKSTAYQQLKCLFISLNHIHIP